MNWFKQFRDFWYPVKNKKITAPFALVPKLSTIKDGNNTITTVNWTRPEVIKWAPPGVGRKTIS